jgi:hypothetical protein
MFPIALDLLQISSERLRLVFDLLDSYLLLFRGDPGDLRGPYSDEGFRLLPKLHGVLAAGLSSEAASALALIVSRAIQLLPGLEDPKWCDQSVSSSLFALLSDLSRVVLSPETSNQLCSSAYFGPFARLVIRSKGAFHAWMSGMTRQEGPTFEGNFLSLWMDKVTLESEGAGLF